MELPPPAPDGEIYVSTKQAAMGMRVAPCTITRWRHLGYLTPIEGSPPRKPMYRWSDVIEAEYTAWQAALAASGTDVQIRRRHAA